MARKKHKFRKWVVGGLVIIIAGLGLATFLNRQWLYDAWRGANYRPSLEVAELQTELQLTEWGEFLFRASQPELNDATQFNEVCRVDENEMAVLGCYTDDTIYIYNIAEPDLAGIVETTAAHELLHAVFKRLNADERKALEPSLNLVLKESPAVLEEDLASYEEEDRLEELYVRAGTQIKDLPVDLEQHYARIFREQDKIVDFYEGYIEVFKNLKTEITELESEIKVLATQIEQKTDHYKQAFVQLNADIVSFNSCAEVAGCFATRSDFEKNRASLVTRQKSLDRDYDALNKLIEEYNTKVEEYNIDILRNEDLNEIINSNSRPKEIEQ